MSARQVQASVETGLRKGNLQIRHATSKGVAGVGGRMISESALLRALKVNRCKWERKE